MTKQPDPEAITTWDALPLFLSHERVASLLGLSKKAIENRVRKGTFRPMPYTHCPMRWSRADLQREWDRTESDAPQAKRLRRVK